MAASRSRSCCSNWARSIAALRSWSSHTRPVACFSPSNCVCPPASLRSASETTGSLSGEATEAAAALAAILPLRPQNLEQRLEAASVISAEVNVLNATQLQGNDAILIENGDDGFLFVQGKRNLVAHFLGFDGSRSEDQQHARTLSHRVFDRIVPFLTRLDIELVDPHSRAGCLQIFGEPKGEFGILAAIAEESGWRVLWARVVSGRAGCLLSTHS